MSIFFFDLRTDFTESVAAYCFSTQGERGLNYARGWPWTRIVHLWVEPPSRQACPFAL